MLFCDSRNFMQPSKAESAAKPSRQTVFRGNAMTLLSSLTETSVTRPSFKRGALTTVSSTALIMSAVSGQAHAQATAQTAQAPVVEEVVVTGTRIVRDGYEAPTPLTV